ncbi:MAG: hypothetical protein LBQ83_00990 [Candidatus Margulisbacteria bacterium]|jgi:hypothetical protein|nr:hypothetical protein [Candidatus Margulisiibacteriota bacterium]
MIYYYALYPVLCLLLCFLPWESYLRRALFGGLPSRKKPAAQGAVLIWKPWLDCLYGAVFFTKGLLFGLSGSLWLAEEPLFIFTGFMLALFSEAYSPLKKTRRILALGLGFLSVYQLWACLVYALIFGLLLALLRYRVPALNAAAGLYALTLIPAGNSYQLAAALVLFILLCIYYLDQLHAYFDGRAPNILAELKG